MRYASRGHIITHFWPYNGPALRCGLEGCGHVPWKSFESAWRESEKTKRFRSSDGRIKNASVERTTEAEESKHNSSRKTYGRRFRWPTRGAELPAISVIRLYVCLFMAHYCYMWALALLDISWAQHRHSPPSYYSVRVSRGAAYIVTRVSVCLCVRYRPTVCACPYLDEHIPYLWNQSGLNFAKFSVHVWPWLARCLAVLW